MTGIERLRRLASDMRDSGWQRMHDDLANIADLIEREYGRSAETVRADAMEAWRWVRKRGGLATLQLHEKTFADMMRQRDEYRELARGYERDATWVREHGGLSHVKDIYNDLRAVVERLGIEWSESELHGLMDALDRRLVPEGGWPRFEDGEMVFVGSDFADGLGETHTVTSVEFFDGCVELHWNPDEPGEFEYLHPGVRVRRPAPKVLDADGVEIREKCDVWWICEGDGRGVHAERLRVETIGPNGLVECSPYNGGTWVYLEPSELYVNEPVLAADGRPLREGEHVWHVETGTELVVKELPKPGAYQAVVVFAPPASHLTSFDPDRLTHERPDSWERITEDIASPYCADYCIKYGVDHSSMSFEYAKACDIVRRAKKLAERGQ